MENIKTVRYDNTIESLTSAFDVIARDLMTYVERKKLLAEKFNKADELEYDIAWFTTSTIQKYVDIMK